MRLAWQTETLFRHHGGRTFFGVSEDSRCIDTVRRFSNGCRLGPGTPWQDGGGDRVVCVEVWDCARGRMASAEAFARGDGCLVFERSRSVRDGSYYRYQPPSLLLV